MLRVMIVFNTLLTFIAVGLSLLIQQFIAALIRHSHFQLFRDRVSDADRDAIFASASHFTFVSILPLIITNVAWIALMCIAMNQKTSVNSQAPAGDRELRLES